MARKILLADDSVTAQNMGRKILADAGYEVITVNNGSAALKKIGEQKPDVIVLDVYMPGYSGLEVCQRLKEVGETSRIPILLTVGKLEPFKQEEVKRVRADGFIVKPFEASELLSALSKLEDRIVPRAESSKPGRFARLTASLEDGRYDKTVAIEEDSGWKNRISFPSKKKEKEEKESQPGLDEAAIYNPVNKDLRTVIEHKAADVPVNGKGEEERVDLGALASAGLPKDVTAEEIAALAAAAAQMQGKLAESKNAESAPKTATSSETAAPQPIKEETSAVTQSNPEFPSATFAEQKPQESIEVKEVQAVSAASSADASETESPAAAEPAQDSQPTNPAEAAEEPVTIAMAGVPAQSGATSSRWSAVSVALAPEDAGISLEQEMQKAYSAFAAAETGHSAASPAHAEKAPVQEAEPTIDSKATEPVVPIPASVAPAVTENLSEVASAATEVISAVAQELEAVAASYVAPEESTGVEPLPVPVEAASVPEPPVPVSELISSPLASAAAAEAQNTEQESSPQMHEDLGKEEPVVSATEENPVAVTGGFPAEESSVISPTLDAAEPRPTSEVPDEAPQKISSVGKESDIAATTAAAWASWHRIRESGSQDAAKAVAAGAEDHPSDVPVDSSDPDVANIVDSVLADLRPKIVEEIARKLGKKK